MANPIGYVNGSDRMYNALSISCTISFDRFDVVMTRYVFECALYQAANLGWKYDCIGYIYLLSDKYTQRDIISP
jgi:hypothetical protein